MSIRRAVIDILKPYEPGIVEFSKKLSEVDGVQGVNVSLIELDEDVENIKATVEGEFDMEKIRSIIQDEGGSIHSIDEVAVGERTVEKVKTPQD